MALYRKIAACGRAYSARTGILGRRILLENVSVYQLLAESEMPEWEFLKHVAEQADCLILLDITISM